MSAAFAVGNLTGAIIFGTEDSALVTELQAGSEEAFALLIAQYQSSIYSLISRVVSDPGDAPDITQDVFIKVFRGIRSFHGESSLRTWIYRIALREALNQRRWWSRHRGREVTIEASVSSANDENAACLKDMLVDLHESPFDIAAHEEIRARVEAELRRMSEPFRSVVILRDLEGLAYDEIAEILGAHLGTVKSRLVRGRGMLRERLADFVARSQMRPSAAAARTTATVRTANRSLRQEAS
ncbi:MAG: sigma-70 family RNA polymerase sigma factor [Acidobacteriaceae bacterium]